MRVRELARRLVGAVRGFGFKQWFLLILNVVLVAAATASLIGLGAVSRTLDSVRASETFRGESDMRFAQIACFFPVGMGKEESDILAFRETLDAKLLEQSLEAPENGSLYLDAYSASAAVTAASDSGSAQVEAVAVGGEFFYFHPLQLRSGSYISSDDLMDDLVVLDFSGSGDDFEVDEGEINIGISVLKGNTELKDAIDAVLADLTADDFNALMDEAISIQPEV